MKKNIQCRKHTLSHKRRAPLCETWKAVFWNANNKCLFVFCKNMSEFPKRPVLSALVLFLENCVCPPALPFRTWGQRRLVETGKCLRCLPWVNRKVFATNPGVLHLLPASTKLCPSNPMTCEKGNTSGPSWLFAAQTEPEAGILDRDTAPPVSSTVDTLYSSQLPPALRWEMLVISWVLTLDSGLHISLRAQGALTSGGAGTPVPETTSLVHHRAFAFYFILNFWFYRSIVHLQCFRWTAQRLRYIHPFSLQVVATL